MMSLWLKIWGKTTIICYPRKNSCYQHHCVNKIYNYILSKMTPPVIYRSSGAVLEILKNYKSDNVQAVNSLLQIYNNALQVYEKTYEPHVKKYPLIILEGLDGSGKSTVGIRLASKLRAKNWCTPPESIKPIRHLFDDDGDLRSAYYALGNYIAALEVAVLLKSSPVVMDRYWHSTVVFAVAQAVHDFPGEVEIPPEGDAFYHWPDDLLKPDAVIFLDVREDIRLQRISRRTVNTSQEELLKQSEDFRKNILLAYKNMVDPEVVFVDGNGNFNSVLREIGLQIKHLLP